MFLIFLLYAICATTFTLSKAILHVSAPIFFVAFRMTIAGIFLLAWHRIRSGSLPRIAQADWFLFAKICFFHIYLAYVCDLWSLQYITSIESAVIFNISPFMAAFFSYVWFHERMTWKKWLGLCIGFASVIPFIIDAVYRGAGVHISGALPIGILLISVISSAYGWVIMRELIKYRKYQPLFINGVGMVVGGLCAFATSPMLDNWSAGIPVTSWPYFLGGTALMMLIANVIFFNLYGYLLRLYTATLLSFAGFTCPLFAALFGHFLLGEALSWDFFISMLAVIVGLTLFYQEELRQGYIMYD